MNFFKRTAIATPPANSPVAQWDRRCSICGSAFRQPARGRPAERCVDCRAARTTVRPNVEVPIARVSDMVDRWVAGQPMAAVAREYGISRERVRQLISTVLTKEEIAEVKATHTHATLKRRQELRHKNVVVRVCLVCGDEFEAFYKSQCCSPSHREIWLSLRFHTETETKQAHRVAVARRAYELDPTDAKRSRYERALTGTQKTQGRWFITDSLGLAAAVSAYRNGWPIFKELPEACQLQAMAEALREEV